MADRPPISALLPTTRWTDACTEVAAQLGDHDELLLIHDVEDDPITERSTPESVRLIAAGEPVSYGQGEKKTGVVLEVLTSDMKVPTGEDSDKEVEASQNSPKYVVALGHSNGFKVFSGSDLSKGEITIDDLDDPKGALKDDKAANEFIGTERTDENGEVAALDWSYPESWRKSKKSNRLILLDAWSSMGGTWRSCYPKYGGKRFCSAMKDRVWGTTI